jgi:hypothetical protein
MTNAQALAILNTNSKLWSLFDDKRALLASAEAMARACRLGDPTPQQLDVIGFEAAMAA